jgi:putative transposase
MIRRPVTTGFWRGRLPHWEVEDGRYFVTIHLHGAIPKQAEERIFLKSAGVANSGQACDSGLPLMRTIFRDMEHWLDRASNEPLLLIPAVSDILLESIHHRMQIELWQVYEFVIMPNHIHLFLSVRQGTLKESIEGFKRWTGHQASKMIELSSGRFWQDEWFDHWSRSDEQDERIAAYIRNNPVKAGLAKVYSDWNYGSWCL